MDIFNTLLLGVIQGLTEFLPVSSSGHLILAQTFLSMDAEPEAGSAMFLEVMLHVATGLAVLVVFRKDIWEIIRGCFSRHTIARKASFGYSGYIILATLPAAIVGVLFNDHIDALFDTSRGPGAAYLASCMLLVTAGLLFYSSMKKDKDGAGQLTLIKAVLIGLIQAVAVMPGISRSGSTIAMALILGVPREEAGRFSFMLALPAIFGAALLDARKVESWGAALTPGVIFGFIAAFVVGLAALKLLLAFVKKGKLHYFGYYCAAAAVVSIVCLSIFR